MSQPIVALIVGKGILYYLFFRTVSGNASSTRAMESALCRSLIGLVSAVCACWAAEVLRTPGALLIAVWLGRAGVWSLSASNYRPTSRMKAMVALGLLLNLAIDIACCVAFQWDPGEFLRPLGITR